MGKDRNTQTSRHSSGFFQKKRKRLSKLLNQFWRKKKKIDRLGGSRKERRVQIDGYWFDSGSEGELYLLLKADLQNDKIRALKCQDVLYLSDARFMMKPDFRVTTLEHEFEWHEMKGNYESEQWKRNIRLWKAGYAPTPTAKLTVWKKNRRELYIWKTIIPKAKGIGMTCICQECVSDYLEHLIKKMIHEIKLEKERDAWLRENESSGL